MADFVAVIRRAVDGLSDNSPEMRAKVYEKARSAVRRQLEAMNPRPSEDLIKRQLDKLETAISDVDAEHAEALPPDEAFEVDYATEPEIVSGPVASEPEPVHHEAPEERVEPASPVVEHYEEPAPAAEEQPAYEPEPEVVAVPEYAAVEAARAVPFTPEPHQEDEPKEHAWPEETQAVEPVADEPTFPEAVEQQPADEVHSQPSWHVAARPDDDPPVGDGVPSWHQPEPVAEVEHEPAVEAVAPFNEPVEPVDVRSVETEAQHAGYDIEPVHYEEPVAAEQAHMPVADEPWNWDGTHASDAAPSADQDAQSDPNRTEPAWDWPGEVAQDTGSKAEPSRPAANEWSDLEDLIGYDRKAAMPAQPTTQDDEGLSAAAVPVPGEVAAQQSAAQRSFRAEPRKSRINAGAIAAVVGLLAILGGAGVGYWLNRDAVHGWVAELMASAPVSETAETTPASDGGERSLPAAGEGERSPTTEVGAVDGSNGKFTQRLLADGTEVDEGPAASLDGAVGDEGRSVSAQSQETAQLDTQPDETVSDAGEAVPGTNAGETETTDAETAPGDTQTPATAGEQPLTLGVAQKMFLYEERLGQTGPTAIEGTVVWSTAEESPGGDARPEPVVRAQLNVPSSGLTALITFRRNEDRSLPASHLVEIVFSLPPTFEGGGIDSVQRVAMKQTEQDRGDPLIAVPAKITDDFHMIALNDFPEAITRNTELLRTRNWIDIPITYRNGRRALITLDKGASGTEAFDTVMRTWATLGTTDSQ